MRAEFSIKDDGKKATCSVCRTSGKQRGTPYFSSVDNFTGNSRVPDSQIFILTKGHSALCMNVTAQC